MERNNEVRASSANPRSLCPDTSAFFFTFLMTHIRDMNFLGEGFSFHCHKFTVLKIAGFDPHLPCFPCLTKKKLNFFLITNDNDHQNR